MSYILTIPSNTETDIKIPANDNLVSFFDFSYERVFEIPIIHACDLCNIFTEVTTELFNL